LTKKRGKKHLFLLTKKIKNKSKTNTVLNPFDYQDTIIPNLAHILLPLLHTTAVTVKTTT